MTTEWLFGQNYNYLTTGAVRPCSADVARARHAAGETYAAVLRSEGRTVAALWIEMSSLAVHVVFIDEHGRDWLTYVFSESAQRAGLLFMEQLRRKEFEGEGKQLRTAEHMSFFEDGRTYSTIKDHVEQTLTKREGTSQNWVLDLHYEPLPGFGDYASILREDRDRPVEDQRSDSPALLAAASRIV